MWRGAGRSAIRALRSVSDGSFVVHPPTRHRGGSLPGGRVDLAPGQAHAEWRWGAFATQQSIRNRPGTIESAGDCRRPVIARHHVQPVIASTAKQSPAFSAPARYADDCFAALAMTGSKLSNAVIPGQTLSTATLRSPAYVGPVQAPGDSGSLSDRTSAARPGICPEPE